MGVEKLEVPILVECLCRLLHTDTGGTRSLNLGLPRGGTDSPIRIPRIFETPGDWFSHRALPPPECPIQWHIVPSPQTELNWY